MLEIAVAKIRVRHRNHEIRKIDDSVMKLRKRRFSSSTAEDVGGITCEAPYHFQTHIIMKVKKVYKVKEVI